MGLLRGLPFRWWQSTNSFSCFSQPFQLVTACLILPYPIISKSNPPSVKISLSVPHAASSFKGLLLEPVCVFDVLLCRLDDVLVGVQANNLVLGEPFVAHLVSFPAGPAESKSPLLSINVSSIISYYPLTQQGAFLIGRPCPLYRGHFIPWMPF